MFIVCLYSSSFVLLFGFIDFGFQRKIVVDVIVDGSGSC